MTRVDREFVVPLRLRIRELVRRSPALEDEYRQRHRYDRLRMAARLLDGIVVISFGLLMMLFVVPAVLALLVTKPEVINSEVTLESVVLDSASLLAWTSLYFAAIVPLVLPTTVGVHEQSAVECHLPSADPARLAPWKIFLCAVPVGVFSAVSWCILTWQTGLSVQGLCAVGLLVLFQSLWIPLLMVLWLGTFRISWETALWSSLLAIGGLSVWSFSLNALDYAWTNALPSPRADAILLLLPTGWVAAMLQYGVLEGYPAAWLLAVPTAALSSIAVRWLRRGLVVHDVYLDVPRAGLCVFSYSFGLVSHAGSQGDTRDVRRVSAGKPSKTSLAERFDNLVHSTLHAVQPRGSRLDTWLLKHCFSERGRDVLQVVTGNLPSVTRALFVYVGMSLGLFLLVITDESTSIGIWHVGNIAALTWAALISWSPPRLRGTPFSWHVSAYLPVGLVEWQRVHWRWSWLVVTALLPFTLLLTGMVVWVGRHDAWMAFDLSLRPMFVLLAYASVLSLNAMVGSYRVSWLKRVANIATLLVLLLLTIPVLFIPLSGNPPWLEGWYRAVLVSATFLLVVILGWITRQHRREYRNLRWDLE